MNTNLKSQISNLKHWSSNLQLPAIALILAAFLALGIVYDAATPLFEKPDEIWHYPYVKYLADGQGLPVQDLARTQSLMKQESTQPPLYYVTAAMATFWIEDDDWQDLVWLNPFWGYNAPGTVNDNKNRVLHTDRERFPYRGAVLAVRIARLVSVLWGAITVLATYLTALELFPKRRSFAAGAAALVAFNPQFIFISSAVSNDSAVSALCTLSLWLMLRLVRRGVSMTKSQIPNPNGDWVLGIRYWVWLGLVLGLAILTKASALALLPVAVVAIAIASWSRGSGWTFLKVCLIVLGVVAIVAGWWYVLNWRLHGDPLGLQVHQAIVGPGRPELTLTELVHELSQIELSFWAAFGWGNVHAPPWIYTLLRIVVRLGALGLVIMVIRNRAKFTDVSLRAKRSNLLPSWRLPRRGVYTEHRRSAPRNDTWPGLALLLLWSLLVFVALLRWLQWIFAPSGRHLFPAIAAITILLLLGLLQLIPGRFRKKATALLAGAMLVFAVICPLAYIAPAYARPPLLSEAAIEAIPHRLDANFGGVMRLLGYNLQPATCNLQPGDSLTVTLYWQSLAEINQDYSVFVHLLDENDLIIAQRNTFPGLGSFPTTLWQVGDAIADTYTLTLPETTYAPSSAELEVGLFDLATGERLPVYGAEGEAVDDNVRFHQIEIVPRSETGLPNPVRFNFGDKIALVGYQMDQRKAEPGEAIRLTLYWQGLAEMKDDYTVFVHLLREGDQIWAGMDRQPQNGAAPTSTWSKGETVLDEYELVIAPDAPPDVYEIEVGLYLPETGDRLDLLDQDGRPMGNRVLLSKVRVE
jgi:4-amino-4-deoxy-L-arabinose transferase-like glycosyltransferase